MILREIEMNSFPTFCDKLQSTQQNIIFIAEQGEAELKMNI